MLISYCSYLIVSIKINMYLTGTVKSSVLRELEIVCDVSFNNSCCEHKAITWREFWMLNESDFIDCYVI